MNDSFMKGAQMAMNLWQIQQNTKLQQQQMQQNMQYQNALMNQMNFQQKKVERDYQDALTLRERMGKIPVTKTETIPDTHIMKSGFEDQITQEVPRQPMEVFQDISNVAMQVGDYGPYMKMAETFMKPDEITSEWEMMQKKPETWMAGQQFKEATKAQYREPKTPTEYSDFINTEMSKGKSKEQAIKAWETRPQRPSTQVDIHMAADKQLVEKTIIELPKLKKEATAGMNMMTQIDNALGLIKKGVTGKGGQIKSFIAPYAEMLGYEGQELTDAQAYQLLTRAIIGPMRLEIVGPGPVSEWEQKLMQSISGGGGTAKGAAIQLLNYWKQLAQSKVTNYNDTLQGITTIAPEINKVYKPVGGISRTIVKTGTNKKTGKKVIQYSDGSIEYAQ